MPASTAKWDDLLLNSDLDPSQLSQIASNLETIAIAIVALSQIGKNEIEQAARDLKVESIVSNWIGGWSSPHTKKPVQLDVKQVRALVLIVSHLAREYQILVRRNINYWEQTIEYRQLPLQSPSLADYISNFIKIYQERNGHPAQLSVEVLSETALELLIELLFYSTPKGHKRLWNALLHRSHAQVIGPAPL